jgi:general secretion pathway protein H
MKLMQSKTAGFTLVEVLIVIVIISIVASITMLSIHFNHNKQIESLAQNIAGLITLAEEEAMLRPCVLGLAFTTDHYQLYSYDENNHHWQPLSSHIFNAQPIPKDTQITLKIHDKIISAEGKPYLIISPSGDIPAFTILIGKLNQEPLYQIIGKESGETHVTAM